MAKEGVCVSTQGFAWNSHAVKLDMGGYLHPSLHQLSAPLSSLGRLGDADGDIMKPSLQIRDDGKRQLQL